MESSFFKTVKTTVHHWYAPLIIGILFIVMAIYTFVSPLESFLALSILFAATFLLTGLGETFFAIANRHEIDNWGWTLLFGLITTLIGFLMLSNPAISMATLPLYVGFVVMFRSVGAISHSLDIKHYGVKDWGSLMIVGILGVLFSFILLWNPIFAGLTVVIWTGIALLTIGIYNVYFSLKLKKLKDIPNNIPQELKDKFENAKRDLEKEIKKLNQSR